jgi:phosphate transport system protein
MPRQEFQHELDEIEALLQDAGRLCGRSLEIVLQVLESADDARAHQVIAGDDEVDSIYLKVESSIESLLARQAPVAVDLRLVLSMIHVNLHLERIGDQCVNIAKVSKLFAQQPLTAELLEDFTVMGNQASGMIATAMASFTQRDLDQAESLVELDQVINERNHGLARRIIEGGFDEATIEMPLRAMLVARAIERIGDNAVDIGEQTAYLVTAQFREFTDASRAASV